MDKRELMAKGVRLLENVCRRNRLPLPKINPVDSTGFNACAYYRPNTVTISVKECAHPGKAGRAWSWPGYVIDRTPYGVLAHELGHLADWHRSKAKGRYHGDFGFLLVEQAGETPITSYPSKYAVPQQRGAETFAEAFRLFCTNPDLLRHFRPRTFELLAERFELTTRRGWRDVLVASGAPARTVEQAEKKIARIR